MRRLVINADDFGLTPGVNRGIAETWGCGVVTSTTLMANGAAFQHAIEMLTVSAPPSSKLGVGCHLVLVDGVPLLLSESVPTLLASGRDQFRTSLTAFACAALSGRLVAGQVRDEAVAQLRKLQQAGLRLSHIDTHKHTHLFPALWKPLMQAARACGVPALRNPFAPAKPLAFAHLLRRPYLWKRYAELRVLRGWAQNFRRAAQAEGMVTTDGTVGILTTGALDLALFRAIVSCIPEGTWELCCHPGYHDADLQRVHTRLRQSRERERELLTSAAARATLERHGIEMISYWDLVNR